MLRKTTTQTILILRAVNPLPEYHAHTWRSLTFYSCFLLLYIAYQRLYWWLHKYLPWRSICEITPFLRVASLHRLFWRPIFQKGEWSPMSWQKAKWKLQHCPTSSVIYPPRDIYACMCALTMHLRGRHEHIFYRFLYAGCWYCCFRAIEVAVKRASKQSS